MFTEYLAKKAKAKKPAPVKGKAPDDAAQVEPEAEPVKAPSVPPAKKPKPGEKVTAKKPTAKIPGEEPTPDEEKDPQDKLKEYVGKKPKPAKPVEEETDDTAEPLVEQDEEIEFKPGPAAEAGSMGGPILGDLADNSANYKHSLPEFAEELSGKGYNLEANLIERLAQAIDERSWLDAAFFWSFLRPAMAHEAFGPKFASHINGHIYMALEDGGEPEPAGEPSILADVQSQGQEPDMDDMTEEEMMMYQQQPQGQPKPPAKPKPQPRM